MLIYSMNLKLTFLIALLAASAANGQGGFYVSFSDGSIRSIDAQGQSSLFVTSSIYPYGLAIHNSGALYVSDGLNQIYRFDSSGAGTLFANTGPRSGPLSMAFGPDGYLYAANYLNDTITRYDGQGRGSLFASGAGLYLPQALAFDSSGLLYVANRGDNTIYQFDSAGRPSLFANTGLSRSFDLAIDGNGNVYVSNFGGPSISRFDAQGQGEPGGYMNAAPSRTPSAPTPTRIVPARLKQRHEFKTLTGYMGSWCW